MTAFRDNTGAIQQVEVTVEMYRAANEAGQSFEQYVNSQYQTAPNQPSAFRQFLASENIHIKGDPKRGILSASIHDMLNGTGMCAPQAGTVLKEGVPASRILFPAALMSALEDKLNVDRETTPNAFEQLIAVDDSINSDRYERPILNFKRPEEARSQVISQLALPNTMLTITASDVTRKIPTFSLGMEISDQAKAASTLDLVGLALARQAATERNEQSNNYILSLLNGDSDQNMLALSAIAGKVQKAVSFDATITKNGELTHEAWIYWLAQNSTKRRITHVVTDLKTALAIENRRGKPTNQNDNPGSPRIDAIPTIMNPSWDFNTKIFITQDPNWPAGTIMGLDSRYGVHRVKSLTAQYEAVEALVMRRSTQMRFDHGEIVYRLFDEAFEVLTLTL